MLSEYKSDRVQMGKTIGRVSNRIKNGEFEVNEEKIQVEKNEGNNHLHGGPKGCSQVWRRKGGEEEGSDG